MADRIVNNNRCVMGNGTGITENDALNTRNKKSLRLNYGLVIEK